jgi:hypothetical protein
MAVRALAGLTAARGTASKPVKGRHEIPVEEPA